MENKYQCLAIKNYNKDKTIHNLVWYGDKLIF